MLFHCYAVAIPVFPQELPRKFVPSLFLGISFLQYSTSNNRWCLQCYFTLVDFLLLQSFARFKGTLIHLPQEPGRCSIKNNNIARKQNLHFICIFYFIDFFIFSDTRASTTCTLYGITRNSTLHEASFLWSSRTPPLGHN